MPRTPSPLSDHLSARRERALFTSVGFAVTITAARIATKVLHDNDAGSSGGLVVDGIHLHHYLWGIALLAGVGAIAVHGEDERRRHPSVALSYGIGLGLIIDEFALLVDLEDVYWSRNGRISVEVGTGLIAAGGTIFAALPVLKRLARNHRPGGRGPAQEAGASAG